MGLAARQALGRSSGFGIAYEKNQLLENNYLDSLIPLCTAFSFRE